MFKKNICTIAILALFTGCVQKNVPVENHDLSNYWLNSKSLNNDKIIVNKNFTEQYNDSHQTSNYVDFSVYKKSKTDLNVIEKYSFFEDINKENYESMISNKRIDLKYNITANEIKEKFELDEKQISGFKRNIKINDKIIEETDIDGNQLVCTFTNYYENMNIKNKVNEFFKSKYSVKDKNYNNVIEISCKDSFIDGEYFTYFAKDIGTILFMLKDVEDGSLVESYSILDTQTILD